ncbi:MAG: sugar transferase [Pirellulales bacterium]
MRQLEKHVVVSPVQSGEFPQKPPIDIHVSPHHHPCNLAGRALALICLVPGLPLMFVLMAIVKLTSRGPALYAQSRVGLQGRIFTMYKLRSMVQNAEADTGPMWSGRRDPRVTWFGRILRATHLDELPQLLNVVRGEMAIFGPRPERPELVHQLAEKIPGYWNRLAVLPGITGLAQINLPPDETIDCVRKKLKLDLEYIEHASWALDARMFAWTLLRLAMVPAGIATGLMWVGREVQADWLTNGDQAELAPADSVAAINGLTSEFDGKDKEAVLVTSRPHWPLTGDSDPTLEPLSASRLKPR